MSILFVLFLLLLHQNANGKKNGLKILILYSTSNLQMSLGYPCRAYCLHSVSLLSLLVCFLVQSDVFISALTHTSCPTTDAMFIHGRKRTASLAYPLQTSLRLPF